jgi:hypothetical protein
MQLNLRAAMPLVGLVAMALLVGACASKREASRPVAAMSSASPASSGASSVAAPNEAVWHLRAGLNVAALSCRGRGRTSVVGAYSRLLSRHRALLAQSYAVEQRRHGAGLDRHQTQLYNRFSNQRSPERFCRNASAVANQANAMDSPGLAANAARLLSQL